MDSTASCVSLFNSSRDCERVIWDGSWGGVFIPIAGGWIVPVSSCVMPPGTSPSNKSCKAGWACWSFDQKGGETGLLLGDSSWLELVGGLGGFWGVASIVGDFIGDLGLCGFVGGVGDLCVLGDTGAWDFWVEEGICGDLDLFLALERERDRDDELLELLLVLVLLDEAPEPGFDLERDLFGLCSWGFGSLGAWELCRFSISWENSSIWDWSLSSLFRLCSMSVWSEKELR